MNTQGVLLGLGNTEDHFRPLNIFSKLHGTLEPLKTSPLVPVCYKVRSACSCPWWIHLT